MTRISSWAGAAGAVAIALASCAHEEPFQNHNAVLDSTFGQGPDRQLTLNPGADVRPAWLRDGTGVVYTFESISGTVHDRCLAILPASGGTRRDLPCATSLAARDTLDAFTEAAPGPAGQLLFTREYSPPSSINPIRGALQLARVDRPDSATTLLTYPYTASNGHLYQGISHIRWLTPTQAVFLASTVTYPRPCQNCEVDTVFTGIELVQLDLSGTAVTTQSIPGTDSASSVDVGASSGEIYFTRNGDSRVYHLTLPGGAPTVVHDFGNTGIARDVAVFGNQLYAVVGGVIAYTVDPFLGAAQLDRGGSLYLVDLNSNTDSRRVIDTRLFKRPVISPQQDHMVAESFPMTITVTQCPGGGVCADTAVSRSSDLWLLDLP